VQDEAPVGHRIEGVDDDERLPRDGVEVQPRDHPVDQWSTFDPLGQVEQGVLGGGGEPRIVVHLHPLQRVVDEAVQRQHAEEGRCRAQDRHLTEADHRPLGGRRRVVAVNQQQPVTVAHVVEMP